MTAVVIGIDPHKRSNTALVLDPQENVLAKQRFPNDRDGYQQLKPSSSSRGGTAPGRSKAPGASDSGWRSGPPPTVSGC
jgi:hypothetical protein